VTAFWAVEFLFWFIMRWVSREKIDS